MPTGGKRAGAGRPPKSLNKLTVHRVQQVERSGKRPPAENLRVIADRAMAMAAHYQPELTNPDTKVKTTNPDFNEERYAYWLAAAREANKAAAPYFTPSGVARSRPSILKPQRQNLLKNEVIEAEVVEDDGHCVR